MIFNPEQFEQAILAQHVDMRTELKGVRFAEEFFAWKERPVDFFTLQALLSRFHGLALAPDDLGERYILLQIMELFQQQAGVALARKALPTGAWREALALLPSTWQTTFGSMQKRGWWIPPSPTVYTASLVRQGALTSDFI